jgi:hypothetical protein
VGVSDVVATMRRRLSAGGSAIVRWSPLPRADEGAQSRVGMLAPLLVQAIALVFVVRAARPLFAPLFAEREPRPLPNVEPPGIRFGLDEKARKEIFAELATAEAAERARAISQNTWNGHLWSREDDRGWHERVLARAIAQRRGISLTQVFLVLDEGIRNHWPDKDGKPLAATTPPLDLRTVW